MAFLYKQMIMKKIVIIATILLGLSQAFSSCKKKESGVCYCSYLSGDKKEFNLTALSRSQQIDSCYVLDGYASAFAGSCKLK